MIWMFWRSQRDMKNNRDLWGKKIAWRKAFFLGGGMYRLEVELGSQGIPGFISSYLCK